LSWPPLAPADFTAFFKAVHGVPPFPWQDRLLQQIAEEGRWPAILDLPTGSGKTAALEIAVFHLALEASRGPERQAPIRIAFVVDHRLIVDDAYARAQHLGTALRWALLGQEEAIREEGKKPEMAEIVRRVRAEPIVSRVALRLRDLAGPGQPALQARRLRGGAPREDDWAHAQPADNPVLDGGPGRLSFAVPRLWDQRPYEADPRRPSRLGLSDSSR
jgi:CRISPR-associated endonuclease/helicase Cas3